MGGMLVAMHWKNWSLPSKLRALKHSTSSPSSSTVVWMEVLCSPCLAVGPRPVGIDPDVWGSADDEEMDVRTAIVVGSEVEVF